MAGRTEGPSAHGERRDWGGPGAQLWTRECESLLGDGGGTQGHNWRRGFQRGWETWKPLWQTLFKFMSMNEILGEEPGIAVSRLWFELVQTTAEIELLPPDGTEPSNVF